MINRYSRLSRHVPERFSFTLILLLIPIFACASDGTVPSLGPVRFEFIIFGFLLLGVALLHKQTFKVALTGLAVLLVFKFVFDPEFNFMKHLFGERSLGEQIMNKNFREGEWGTLLNLTGLLLGFAILAKVFEQSGIPEALPRILPGDWKGAFILLVFVFILSTFLDNIAAALIGGTIALVVFRNKVHVGYIAAIVAASNAGGSGSVIGDTTTTMMWIDGVSALNVLHGFIAAISALLFFGWFASRQQDKYQSIVTGAENAVKTDPLRLLGFYDPCRCNYFKFPLRHACPWSLDCYFCRILFKTYPMEGGAGFAERDNFPAESGILCFANAC